MLIPPSYPVRPISGGPFNLAPKKFGEWVYELKYNGWRALVHGPTGRMFNRHLKPLSIQNEFAVVLPKLAEASSFSGVEWWDCEALERRHDFARGSLVVLDAVLPSLSYKLRHKIFETLFEPAALLGPNELKRTWGRTDGNLMWELVSNFNEIRPGFVEGIVGKRLDSDYPFQLRNASQEYTLWVKHRIHY